MPEPDPEVIVAALLPATGIPMDPAWRAAVAANLRVAAAIAQALQDVPLPDQVEPARAAGVFADHDVLLAPCTPMTAPPLGTQMVTLDGVELPLRPSIGVHTQPVSFIGLPVVAVPVWPPGAALPMGVQVIAPPWREDLALRVARMLEREGIARAPVAPFGA